MQIYQDHLLNLFVKSTLQVNENTFKVMEKTVEKYLFQQYKHQNRSSGYFSVFTTFG